MDKPVVQVGFTVWAGWADRDVGEVAGVTALPGTVRCVRTGHNE
jgi:hypothetical protein